MLKYLLKTENTYKNKNKNEIEKSNEVMVMGSYLSIFTVNISDLNAAKDKSWMNGLKTNKKP